MSTYQKFMYKRYSELRFHSFFAVGSYGTPASIWSLFLWSVAVYWSGVAEFWSGKGGEGDMDGIAWFGYRRRLAINSCSISVLLRKSEEKIERRVGRKGFEPSVPAMSRLFAGGTACVAAIDESVGARGFKSCPSAPPSDFNFLLSLYLMSLLCLLVSSLEPER